MKTSNVALIIALGAATLATAPVVAQDRGADGERQMARMDRDHGGREHSRRGQGRMIMLMETFDTDGDGSVSQAEIDAVRAERLQEFDADGDGALSLEEYEALWLDAMRERMVDRFQDHDDDGDGVVTLEEFSERYDGVVARRDRNGDGVLNRDDMRGSRRSAPEQDADEG